MDRMAWALLVAMAACSGGDTGTPPLEPEICDNEIDDNGNGLVDCDDSSFCGGIQCATTTGDDDDDDLPDIEIDYDGDALEFTYTVAAGVCNQPIRAFTIINRSDSVDALVDASCDLLPGGESVIGFDIDGANPRSYVVDEDLPLATSMEVGMIFACRGVDEVFTTTCRLKADLAGLVSEVEFDVTGTPQ